MTAPLAVAVEIRALDTGDRLVRAFRLSRALDDATVRFERDLPFEAGRPVALELLLPDDPTPVRATGRVAAVAPDDPETEGEAARPRAVTLGELDPDTRRRIEAYVTERLAS
jgi:hypothetical protein